MNVFFEKNSLYENDKPKQLKNEKEALIQERKAMLQEREAFK